MCPTFDLSSLKFCIICLIALWGDWLAIVLVVWEFKVNIVELEPIDGNPWFLDTFLEPLNDLGKAYVESFKLTVWSFSQAIGCNLIYWGFRFIYTILFVIYNSLIYSSLGGSRRNLVGILAICFEYLWKNGCESIWFNFSLLKIFAAKSLFIKSLASADNPSVVKFPSKIYLVCAPVNS